MAIRYTVNEKKRCVTAVIDNAEMDAINLINKRSGGQLCLFRPDLIMRGTYVARVTCHDSDTFDPEVGKEIAKARVLEKYDRDLKVVLNRFQHAVEMLQETSKSIDDYVAIRDKRADVRASVKH